MNKTLLALAALAATSLPLFAVDGQVLINQSTVMASGGFPYRITQSGSYKLSGNLVATTDQQAILITANNVTLDLNGFTAACAYDTNLPAFQFTCVGDGGAQGVSDVTIRNGSVTATQSGVTSAFGQMSAVGFTSGTSARITVEDLHTQATVADIFIFAYALSTSVNSILRHNIFAASSVSGEIGIVCPSLIVENINTTSSLASSGSGCISVNNIGPF